MFRKNTHDSLKWLFAELSVLLLHYKLSIGACNSQGRAFLARMLHQIQERTKKLLHFCKKYILTLFGKVLAYLIVNWRTNLEPNWSMAQWKTVWASCVLFDKLSHSFSNTALSEKIRNKLAYKFAWQGTSLFASNPCVSLNLLPKCTKVIH